jgi:uncharacterized protein with NAD-binding domain and iron-sulfur cluster
MRETVAIIGGGVAGLSAAHELIERGFDVEIYDRRSFFGGKAASYRVLPKSSSRAGAAPDDGYDDEENRKRGLPGEHGFRFFPGWYRHLIDTMTRIPYHHRKGGVNSVDKNLVSVRTNLLAWFGRSPLLLPLQVPGNLAEAAATSHFFSEFNRIGLSASESALFMRKLVEFLVMPEQRRVETLEAKTWWEFLECDNPDRSRAYQDLVRASTRTSVAAKAEDVSAYTVGKLMVRTLLDTLGSVDRVLNGPTSEMWIQPWVEYLESSGVKFKSDMELSSIALDRVTSKVRSVTMEPVVVSSARRLRNRFDEMHVESKSTPPSRAMQREALEAVKELLPLLKADDAEEAAALATQLETYIRQEPAAGTRVFEETSQKLDTYWFSLGTRQKLKEVVHAQYFVLALPVEQLAYYVDRSSMLAYLAPELRRVMPLSREVDWMAGIQFYLQTPIDVAPGHLVGLDSNWALTAIEQTRFWDDVKLPDGVRGVLSVDISAWDRKGLKVRKEAFNCSDEEIAEEVWAELKLMLNRPNRAPVLQDKLLVGGTLVRRQSYHLDDSVVDLRDRKKEAAYDRARGFAYGVVDENAGDEGTGKIAEHYMFGAPTRRYNAEPLLVNRPGSWKLRPEARTSIPNLFIAGDYVRTETDLACMEGANEAARLAVNGVLDAAGSNYARCRIWPFSPSRHAVDAMMSMVVPLQAVRGVTSMVASLSEKMWKGITYGR